ncbi:MAG: cupredoxin domain-containing protein [Gammaproteobacteria bacterium]|jgi:hypothetical protein
MKFKHLSLPALILFALAGPAAQADVPQYDLIIKDHQFTPANLEIPAGKKVKLVVKNQDATPEEFESHELNREKMITGNSSAVIYVGPLDPGSYKFFGEFNPKTAQGTLIVK